jgi:hypothetical protein
MKELQASLFVHLALPEKTAVRKSGPMAYIRTKASTIHAVGSRKSTSGSIKTFLDIQDTLPIEFESF